MTNLALNIATPGTNALPLIFYERRGALPTQQTYDAVSVINPPNQSVSVSIFSSPPLNAGWYYFELFNPNPANEGFTLSALLSNTNLPDITPVIISLTNGVPFTTNFPPGSSFSTIFQFDVPQPSPSAVLFSLYDLSGNADLNCIMATGQPFFSGHPYSVASTNPGTNLELLAYREAAPGFGVSGTAYLRVPNNENTNVTFTICATCASNRILLSPLPLITTFIPGTALTVTETENEVQILPGSSAYCSVGVPANAIFATNTLITASAPVNVLFNQNQPPGTGGADLNVFGGPVVGGVYTFTSNTLPQLVPGQTYYLGVKNTGTTSVDFAFSVSFELSSTDQSSPTLVWNPPASSTNTTQNPPTFTPAKLVWNSIPGELYEIQFSTNPSSPGSWGNFATVWGNGGTSSTAGFSFGTKTIFTLPTTQTNPAGFYRLEQLPAP